MSKHTTNEVQDSLNDLNVVYRAAMANLPTGLVAEALAAQQKGINDAAQRVADMLQTLIEEPVAEAPPEPTVVPRAGKK